MASMLVQDPYTQVGIIEFSTCVGMSKNTIHKRIQEAQIKPVSTEGAHPKYAFVDLCRAAFSASNSARNDDGTVDPTKLMPGDAKTYWASRKLQIAVQEKERQLVPALKVEREYAKLVKDLVQALDTLPDTLERETTLPPESVSKLHSCIATVREKLAKSIFSHEEVRQE